MRTRKVPHLRDFVEGRHLFLWIVGRPGISKTESITAAGQEDEDGGERAAAPFAETRHSDGRGQGRGLTDRLSSSEEGFHE